MKYWLTCLAIIVLAAVECRATPLALNEAQEIYTPGASMFILEDPGGALTIDEVSQPEFATRFAPCREDRPNFGFTKSTYWARVTVHNQTTQQDSWLVELLFANLHYVDFYRPAPDGTGYLAIKTGVMRPATTRDVAHHRFFFRLPLAPGDTQTVYLRVQNGASMTLAIQILTLEAYARRIRGEYLFLGIFFAALLMLGLYSAFVWYSLRDRIFLFYVFSQIGILCWFLAYSGIGGAYLWAGIPDLNRYAMFWGSGIYGIIMVQFTMFVLQITRRQPIVFAIFTFLQLILLVMMAAPLVLEYGSVIRLLILVALVGGLAVAVIGGRGFLKGVRPARDYLLGIGSGGIWIALLPFVRFGIIPSTFLTEHAIEIGALSFSVVWAFALMRRVTFLRQEQEQTFAALQDSEQKFRDIAKNIPGMVYQFRVRQDGSTYFSYASPRANELFGLSNDLSSQEWELGARLHPDDRESFFASVNHAIQTCTNWNYEGRMLLPDGSFKWFQGISSPIRVNDELVFNGILMDISGRKQAEEQIRQLNAELETRVQHRTANLEAANKELRSFAYVVSHDLKTPLRGISHLAQWLVEDYAAAFDEEGKRLANLLIGRVQRMDDLIEGILQYSRAGRVAEDERQIDLNTLVRNVIENLSPPEHIQIVIERDLPEVVGDQTHIVQVFQNLIGNAVKFLDKPVGKITVSCVDEGPHWTFRVADNGPGIDGKYHDKIFQIFQTLRSGGDRESTGIGLALVKKIVELYGGQICIESTPGQGSVFSFTWPKRV